jgi:hypothetical protein
MLLVELYEDIFKILRQGLAEERLILLALVHESSTIPLMVRLSRNVLRYLIVYITCRCISMNSPFVVCEASLVCPE